MDTTKLGKLIDGHDRIAKRIKEKEAELKEELAPLKAKLAQVQEVLCKYIHKEEGGIQKVSLPDGRLTAYARYADKYKIKDRDALVDEYILADIPVEYADRIRDRLDIFTNSITTDPCVDYRTQSGAEEVNDRLVGGAMIPGTGIHTVKEVRILQGRK